MARKPIIAHIDDSDIVTSIVKAQLEGCGWEVCSYNSTLGLINKLLAAVPDLILMDVRIPHLGGDSYIQVLKQSEKLRSVPVIFYSAMSSEELEDLVQNTEADAFIEKTDDAAELDQQLRSWLGRRTSP